jgi:hypothetical protein
MQDRIDQVRTMYMYNDTIQKNENTLNDTIELHLTPSSQTTITV